MNSLEQKLDDLFLRNLPGMPAGARETAAKVMPWVLIVLGVIGLILWVSSLRIIFGMMGLWGHMAGAFYPGIFTIISLIIAPLVQLLVIYGGYLMLSRQRKGWLIALYALMFSFISNLLALSILGLIINFIFAYVLFQIKSYYLEG